MNEAIGRLSVDWKALTRRLRPSGEKIWLVLTALWCLFLLRDLVNVKLGTYYFIIDPAHFRHGLITDAYMTGMDLFLVSFYWFMYQRSKNKVK